jgi:hypothetical protein
MAMSSNNDPQAKKLVKEGIEAIKEGDKQLGRGKLETAVKIDPYNELAWLWLAKVVTTVEERRTCLGNVILINPSNTEAQRMLDKIEDASDKRATTGVMPALVARQPRRNRILIWIIALLLLVLVCVGGFSLLGGGEEAVVVPTVITTETFTVTPDSGGTATALASITPTLTITPSITPALAVATWTFTPAPTDSPTPQLFPPPPAELAGRIILQSGRVAGDPDNQPIAVIEPANLASRQLVSGENQRGQHPILLTGQNRFVWSLYSSGTRALSLQIQSFGAAQSVSATSIYGNIPLTDPNYPTWSGTRLVFSAKYFGSANRDLWLLPLTENNLVLPDPNAPTATPTMTLIPSETPIPTQTLAPEITPSATLELTPTIDTGVPFGSPLVRLTQNEGDHSWPSFDPTGQVLVFVTITEGITDLHLMTIADQIITPLHDNQNSLIESAPDWAGDVIVFSASADEGETSDLYLIAADGQTEPTLLLDLGPRDVQPRFSPDGRYIAFSSDYYGNWDAFIYDRETETLYQLEGDPNSTDLVNDWAE